MQDLGTLGGTLSRARAINDSGYVVGTAQTTEGYSHAFFYNGSGFLQDLGTLGGTSSSATGINNYGQIVGASSTGGQDHAFLRNGNGPLQDLNNLIAPSSGWTLLAANGINDKGQIIVDGFNQALEHHAFLLTPPPAQVTLRSASYNPVPAAPAPVGIVPGSDQLEYFNSETGNWNEIIPGFDPAKRTYVLTHDGVKGLLAHSALTDMSGVAAAIAAHDPGANILGWDWENRLSFSTKVSARRASGEQGLALAGVLGQIGLTAQNTILIGDGLGGYLASSAAGVLGTAGNNVSRVVLLDTYSSWLLPGTLVDTLSANLKDVTHVDNLYYGGVAGSGSPMPKGNVFNFNLNLDLVTPFEAIRDWYTEAIQKGVTIDGASVDILSHTYTGHGFEFPFRRGFGTSAWGPIMWSLDHLPDPQLLLLNDMSDPSSWNGQHAKAVTVAAANGANTNAVQLTEGSDGYMWKELTLPLNAVYLSFDAIFQGPTDSGDSLVVSFGDEIIFSDSGKSFNDTLWTNSGPIYIGDLAGQSGVLQFCLRSEGDPGSSILIGDVAVVTPEPATLSLLALGGLAMIRRRRR